MLIDDNDPVYVAACIDRMVRDKTLRADVIEKQNNRLAYFQYDNIAGMFEKYLKAFIEKNV